MNLITGLPTHNGKDAILTIVDHGCSRAAIFLPCATMITGSGIAQLYLNHVYRWFGLPTKVISDRDPRFTSHFGRALSQKLGVQQNLSMAFHPQTDGLSEWKNQWVEQYLHLVMSASPEDWTHWMAIATAVHNNRKNATTGLSPNDILFGYEPNLAPQDSPPANNEAAQQRIELLKEKRTQVIDAINKTARSGQTIPSQFQVGNQFWLEATHLKLRHQKTKLAPKRYGPFQIVKEVLSVAYQIKLPASWGIHDVFHASLLSPYHEMTAHGPNFSQPSPDLIDGEEEYEVERVVNHRRHGKARRLQYLIKWKGYPESDNTWEPLDQVHAPELIREYHRHFPLKDKRARARLIAAILRTGCPSSQNPHSNPSLHTSSRPSQSEELSSPTSSSNLHSPSIIGITSSVTNFPKATPGNTCHIATTTGVHSITLTDHKRCPTTTATAPHTMFAAPRHWKNGQPMLTASPLDHHTMTWNPHALGQKTLLLKNGPLTLSMPRRKRLPSHQYLPCGETPLTDHMLALGAHEHSQGKTIGRHTL
jgi:hypothetical protein